MNRVKQRKFTNVEMLKDTLVRSTTLNPKKRKKTMFEQVQEATMLTDNNARMDSSMNIGGGTTIGM